MRLVSRLEEKTFAVLNTLERQEAYRLIFTPGTDREFVVVLLRNVLLQTHYYGSQVTEAVFTALGRFPRTKPNLTRPLVEQVLDEIYHPELALKDYIKMGGDEQRARSGKISSVAFCVGAVCRMLAQYESPFAYLGFLALLEFTTPVLTERAMPILQASTGKDTRFIPLHAKEDHEHAAIIKRQIEEVVATFPAAGKEIEFGFDCFSVVYPSPVWDEALRQTRSEFGGRNAT